MVVTVDGVAKSDFSYAAGTVNHPRTNYRRNYTNLSRTAVLPNLITRNKQNGFYRDSNNRR